MPYGELGRCGVASVMGRESGVPKLAPLEAKITFLAAAALRVLEHVEQADDIDLRVVDRVAGRDRDRMLGGVVVHDVGLELGKDPGEAFVAHVHVHQRDAAGYVDAPAAAVLPERVDDQNLVPRREVGVRDVRSDESGAAGNDDADDVSSCSS